MYRVVVLLICCLSLTATAEVYRWVDAKGRVHFGDKASRTDNAKSIEMEKPAATIKQNNIQQDQQQRLLESWQDERQAVAAQKQEANEVAQQRQQNCVKFKQQLNSYQQSRALYVDGDDGQLNVLTDQQRAEEEARVASEVSIYCD